MRQGSKLLPLFGTVLVLLVLLMSWSYIQMASQRRAAQRSTRELSDCTELAAQINAIKQQPKRAQEGVLAHTDLTRKIERAAGAAGIGSESLTRIDASPPRRLAKLPYEERPTRIALSSVSLTQLVTALHRLSNQSEGLWVKGIHLRAPRGEEVGDRWHAEVTMSYLIYTPTENADTE
jgi:DNA-binding FrmR family transcriptional regulator